MASNFRKTRALLPPQALNISFEDAMTCEVGFNDDTIITLFWSKVINFPLPVLSCHVGPPVPPWKLDFHQHVVEFFKNNQLNQKGMN